MVYLYYQNTKIMFCSKESSSPSSKAFSANYDYLVVVIMSHGTKGTIRTCDPLDPTNLEASSFRIDDFTLTLSKTRGLTGKPKFIFVNACRGNIKNPSTFAISNNFK